MCYKVLNSEGKLVNSHLEQVIGYQDKLSIDARICVDQKQDLKLEFALLNFGSLKICGTKTGSPCFEGNVGLAELLEGHDDNAEIGSNVKFLTIDLKKSGNADGDSQGQLYIEIEYVN